MNEECIIRKLISDGDGAGDDRRFLAVFPLLMKLMREPELSQSLIPRIFKTLDAAETAMKKQVLISGMNEQQINDYALLTKQIELEIVRANEQMVAAKKELGVAKGIRKNKEEYELLARMIDKIPTRSETNRKLETIKKELEELHEKQRNLETKLADRRNHLHAFNIILANFCRFLKDEEGDELSTDELMESSNPDIRK